MSLSRVVLRLARNPGTAFAAGDEHRGYAVTVPLTSEGRIDEAIYGQNREACTVRRFAPDQPHADGRLARRGANWFFDYDAHASDDDEPIHRLGGHAFVVGEYLTVTDENRQPLTYRVAEVQSI